MSESSSYVEFFRALRAASPGGMRSISTSSVAVMALIYTSAGRSMSTRTMAEALGLTYTNVWNHSYSLMMSGFVVRSGKAWALTDTGVRVMDVLAGVSAAASSPWDYSDQDVVE